MWNFYYRRAYFEDLEAGHAVGLACARSAADLEGQAMMHNGLAQVAAERNQFDVAVSHLQRVRDFQRRAGNRNGEAMALGNMGMVAEMQQQYERALECHLEALAIDMTPGGNEVYRSTDLENIGNVYIQLGRYEEALDVLRQSLGMARKTGNRAQQVFTLRSLGSANLETGDLDAAHEHLCESLTLARELGDPTNEACALSELGKVSSRSGDDAAALKHWHRAMAIYEELRDSRAAEVRACCSTLLGPGEDVPRTTEC